MKFLNIKNFNSINKIQLICIFSLLGFAIYLSFIGGYGADEDTLPMIYVFESKLDSGNFVSSRFTGNPVAEIGIGFLAYFFGSWAANLTTFIFLIIGLLLFYYSFEKKDNKELLLFLLLCLSSPVLFFDNLEPVDYSWAFFFYALGLFLLKNKLTELSIIFFALAVGVRLNYFLFIVITILFFNDTEIPLKKKLIIIFCIFFTGALFYVPVWFDSKLQLTWLTAGRSYDGYLDLLSRFSYKSFYAFGGFSIFFVIYSFYKNYLKLIEDNNLFLFLFLLFSNLLIFLWLPAELSYLQLAIICVYLFIIRYSQKKLIYLILIYNFATWIINPEFLVIKYKQMESMCSPKQAIKADLKFSLDKGYYFKYMNTRKMINCFAPGDTERNKRIRQGLSIR
jgi:hypothetical protein|tara:strand:+ start:3666 stop:4847 length:1182 start_codon:yes stop_codon:yes gene_type:complete